MSIKPILDNIHQPCDLRRLTGVQLNQLATEIRQEIITTVNSTGGHIASSLGAVELAIALHRVFDSPNDKIVWDVGHQAYAHKLLTGRHAQFSSLRQHGGLSGFIDPAESPHDSFISGHASTSVSAALGMAAARDLEGDTYSVIAVIGDGALTGGMAFEALNQAGHLRKKLVVVLNDNNMSIAPTVGALSKFLNKVWTDRRYEAAEKRTKQFLIWLPLGKRLWLLARKMKHIFKGFFLPVSIWEELGFNYMGPFDGHDIRQLENALYQARRCSGKPAFVHVITTKGKGYPPAEADAVRFHGVGGGKQKKSQAPTYSEVFAATLLELMHSNKKIVAITAAMSDGNGLNEVLRRFPDRVFDVGICEEHAVTFGAGLASRGYIPVVAIYSTFLQRAFDQLIHDVCLQDLPVVLALDRSGIVGEDGKTHHGLFDLSYLTLIPNLIVSAPKDEDELRHLLYTASTAGHPMAIRYPRGQGPGAKITGPLKQLPIGNCEVLQDGNDLIILSIGSTVSPSLAAANRLSAHGVKATVVNARFVKPLDRDRIGDLCRRARRLVTVEENTLLGGFGTSVATVLHEMDLSDVTFKSIGIPDQFVEHGSQELLRAKYGLDVNGIVASIIRSFPEFASASITARTEGLLYNK